MTLLDIDRKQLDENTVVLEVSGYLDAFSVTDFRQATAENKRVPKLIINLGATFLDSAGLNALVAAVSQVRDHRGEAAIVCADPRTASVLYTTGFDRVVTLSATVDDARFALDRPEGEAHESKDDEDRHLHLLRPTSVPVR
ncbi:MAG TPA: anti-sigma factor antagonist [Acidimicrobiales bacterium]|nr:anti-sigma factor antagonist [Acidimicrobiales bacterium]